MSKIDELFAQYCPNGVDFKELGEVLDYEQPNKYNGLIYNSGMGEIPRL